MAKLLMKGNEAIGAAAIQAGCRYFFGYPITPQNELPEYMSRELPKVEGTFVQAESEVAAINMVYGAAGAGGRVMTSSSSPGIALKQEGISYIAAAELPCLIVNIMRSSPGLGGILPAQGDYFMATRGGGNGDYFMPVYAPATLQEAVDMVREGFDVAEQYRTPVMVLGDGMIGQMMEAVEFTELKKREIPSKAGWMTDGTRGKREPHIINSLNIVAEDMEAHIAKLSAKWDTIRREECRWDEYNLEGADVVAVAYGTTSRVVRNAVKILEDQGIRLGLIRPRTLWPFPYQAFDKIDGKTRAVLSVELSTGQMVDDVKIGVAGRQPVEFYGRTGGVVPTPEEIAGVVAKIAGGAR